MRLNSGQDRSDLTPMDELQDRVIELGEGRETYEI